MIIIKPAISFSETFDVFKDLDRIVENTEIKFEYLELSLITLKI